MSDDAKGRYNRNSRDSACFFRIQWLTSLFGIRGQLDGSAAGVGQLQLPRNQVERTMIPITRCKNCHTGRHFLQA